MRIPSIRVIPMAILTGAAFGLAAWALSPGVALAEGASGVVPSGEAAQIPCLCRYAGTTYEQAECACLPTPNGPRLACCGKVLNNSSWMFLGESCLLSQNRPNGGGGEAGAQLARRASEPR